MKLYIIWSKICAVFCTTLVTPFRILHLLRRAYKLRNVWLVLRLVMYLPTVVYLWYRVFSFTAIKSWNHLFNVGYLGYNEDYIWESYVDKHNRIAKIITKLLLPKKRDHPKAKEQ